MQNVSLCESYTSAMGCDLANLATLSIHRLVTAEEAYFRGSVFLVCGSLKGSALKCQPNTLPSVCQELIVSRLFHQFALKS